MTTVTPRLAPITTVSSSAAVHRRHHLAPSSGFDPANPPVPTIDDDLLLRHGRRWVALTDRQAVVVRHLLDNLDTMVSASELSRIYAAAGGSTEGEAIRSFLFRLARRLAEVDLQVTFARRRSGMMVSLPVVDVDAAIAR